MKYILWPLAVLALALPLAGCGRLWRRVPEAAVQACGAPRALLAVRRGVFRQAADQGASEALLGRLRQGGRASLEDPAVQDYDRGKGIVICTAMLRLQPPGQGAQEISSSVTYQAQPLRTGGWRYKLTDPGQAVQAIASLAPLPPEPAPIPASSAAADASAQATPPADSETLDDAAAAGDTGRSHQPPPPAKPAGPKPPTTPAPPPN
jgi:hypothetical protein